jgi:dTDP-4-amino-4,6-dideoxygalactose transaminase
MSALEMTLRAYGIGTGDEVITAANTFIATALAISHVGATPVLVDCDPLSYTMDVAATAAAISTRTAAILPVHLYGHPAKMDELEVIARRHGLLIIEDACQAHGARYRGRRAGSLGHAAAFSFYPGKNLGAYGDGGMITTGEQAIADKLRVMRNYGQAQKYQHLMRGYNRRLDTLQAAVLSVKLRHLDIWNEARRRHAALYFELLADAAFGVPVAAEEVEPVWHLYVVRTAERDALQQHLKSVGVATGIHYPIPIHLQQAYHDLGYSSGSFPVTEAAAGEILSLPMYAELTAENIRYVAGQVNEFSLLRDAVERAA